MQTAIMSHRCSQKLQLNLILNQKEVWGFFNLFFFPAKYFVIFYTLLCLDIYYW